MNEDTGPAGNPGWLTHSPVTDQGLPLNNLKTAQSLRAPVTRAEPREAVTAATAGNTKRTGDHEREHEPRAGNP
jgi:hypothetical protein